MGLLTLMIENKEWIIYFPFVLIGLYTICRFVDTLYLHPLAKYPGPFLAKFTTFYAGYHAWKGDVHVDMWRCYEKYGPFVRYSPNQLIASDADAINDIYGAKGNFQKSPNYRVMRHQAANTLTMVNKKQHGRRRRIISRAVSNTAMREHEPTMLYHIRKLLDAVSQTDDEGLGLVETIKDHEEGWSKTRNMTHWCNYLTFDIMGDVIFGVKLNLLDKFANRYIVSAIENSNVRVSVLIQSPILGTKWMGRLDRYLFPKAIEARGHFLKFVSGLVNHTRKLNCSPAARTVFSVLTTSSDPETGDTLSAKELMAESTTLCVAGSDTSSTALAALFFYLARNPCVYDRVAQEIRSAFKSKDEIRMGATLNSLTYLRACIDEALRMSPPAGSSLYREVMSGGATVCGQYFPTGVEIGVPIYGIHHNPKYFPAPHTYRPERWIVGEGGSTQQSVELAQSAHIPFSVGPRSCVGKIMALNELMLSGALALYTLDFRMEEGDSNGGRWGADKGFDEPGEYVLHDHITASKNGPMIQFRQRKVE